MLVLSAMDVFACSIYGVQCWHSQKAKHLHFCFAFCAILFGYGYKSWWYELGAIVQENGYEVMFLSARAISQAYLTRQFLFNLKQVCNA